MSLNTFNPHTITNTKEKAMSTAGFRMGGSSFDREEMASRFKHLGRKEDDENKTIITGKWKAEADQSFRASIEANEKNLKLEILKYKTKFEESERNLEEKGKELKRMKEQIGDLNRQLT